MIVDEDAEEENQPDGWIEGGEIGVKLSERGHCRGGGDVPGIHKQLGTVGLSNARWEGKSL